jgi:hypothetical protein
VWTDGYKCIYEEEEGVPCGFIQRALRNIQEHCRTKHGWINPLHRDQRARNNSELSESQPWAENVTCQRFFKTGGFQRYFKVEQKTTQTQEQLETAQLVVRVAKNTFKKKKLAREEALKQQVIDGRYDRYSEKSWLERTGWAQHLAGLEPTWLAELIRTPDQKKKKLAQVCKKLEKLIFRAQTTAQANKVKLPAMFYINRRKFKEEQKNKKLFYTR